MGYWLDDTVGEEIYAYDGYILSNKIVKQRKSNALFLMVIAFQLNKTNGSMSLSNIVGLLHWSKTANTISTNEFYIIFNREHSTLDPKLQVLILHDIHW